MTCSAAWGRNSLSLLTNNAMFNDLQRISLETCVLIAFGALFGLTLNHQLVLDAFSGRLTAPQGRVEQELAPAALPMPVLIDEVQQVLAAGGLVVDARSPELYAEGHIDGAVSLPLVEIDAALIGFLAGVAKDQPIIAYRRRRQALLEEHSRRTAL